MVEDNKLSNKNSLRESCSKKMYGFAKMFTKKYVISGSQFFPLFFINILNRQKIILSVPCRNTDRTSGPVTAPCM